jgi:hypothetical protein
MAESNTPGRHVYELPSPQVLHRNNNPSQHFERYNRRIQACRFELAIRRKEDCRGTFWEVASNLTGLHTAAAEYKIPSYAF